MNILSNVFFTNRAIWDRPVQLNCSEPSTSGLAVAMLVLQARRHEYILESPLHKLCDFGWYSAVTLHRSPSQKSDYSYAILVVKLRQHEYSFPQKSSLQSARFGVVQCATSAQSNLWDMPLLACLSLLRPTKQCPIEYRKHTHPYRSSSRVR